LRLSRGGNEMGPTLFDLWIILGLAASAAVLFKIGMPKIASLLAAAGAIALIANLLRLMGYRI
jgi:hypothetical protein